MKRKTLGNSKSNKRVRKDTGTAEDYPDDKFDQEKEIDIATDTCALCKQGHLFGVLLKRELIGTEKDESEETDRPEADVDGIWVSRYSLMGYGSRRIFVHFFCAATCPRAWFTAERVWKGVSKEINRGRGLKCSECKMGGATIGCFVPSCSVVMHLPCAVKHGFRLSRYTSNNFVCRKHRSEREKEDRKKDSSLPSDFTRGKEKIPIHCENQIDDLNPLQDFTYITENIDSDDFALNERDVSDLPCCQCTDLCDDPEKCACLKKSGKSYSLKGSLLNSSSSSSDVSERIVECNLRCDCSFRRCSNRVVSNGLNRRLELFRVANDPRHQWGVRLLENVEPNTFICEINGQIVKKPDNPLPYQFVLPHFEPRPIQTIECFPNQIRENEEKEKEAEEQVKGDENQLYCLDCSVYGNISRFIRRAPSGTGKMLERRYIYTNSNATAVPRIGLFSTVSIYKGQELFR